MKTNERDKYFTEMAFFLIFFSPANFFKINGANCLVFSAFKKSRVAQSGTMTTRFFKETGLNYILQLVLA